jgi:hypothetical protein
MSRSFLVTLAAGAVTLLPLIAFAADADLNSPIINSICNCPGTAPGFGCVLQVIQNLMNLAVTVGVIITTLVAAYAGILWITSPFNAENRTKGRSMLMNAVIGLVITLSAWLIVDFVMKALYNSQVTVNQAQVGPWNAIISTKTGGNDIEDANGCIKPKTGAFGGGGTVTVTPGGGTTPGNGGVSTNPGGTGTNTGGTVTTPRGITLVPSYSSSQLSSRASAAMNYSPQLCSAARSNGLSGQEASQLFGILGVESNGNATASSGVAYGLMQVRVDTARTLDSTLSGASDSAVIAKLNDPSYNISIGTAYYASLYHQYGNDIDATAAYNGGPGTGKTNANKKQAFAPSSDCATSNPGSYAWECPINPGGFAETQQYVPNVTAVAAAVGTPCN